MMETRLTWRLWALSLALILTVLLALSFVLDVGTVGATGRFAWNALIAAVLVSARGLDTVVAFVLRRRIWRLASLFTTVGLFRQRHPQPRPARARQGLARDIPQACDGAAQSLACAPHGMEVRHRRAPDRNAGRAAPGRLGVHPADPDRVHDSVGGQRWPAILCMACRFHFCGQLPALSRTEAPGAAAQV